ncbi:MAG: hypothetical protein R3C61_17100 [Bacteroidia bacterium]
MASPIDSSKMTSRAILVIVGILVLSALAYFSVKYFSEKSANEENAETIDNLNNEILQLEEKILNLEVAIEDQNMELAEKDKLLEEKYEELEAMVGRVAEAKKENKANIAKIKQLESHISELKGLIDQYSKQIDYLKEQNRQLTGQVDSLVVIEGQLTMQNKTLTARNEETTRELEQTRKIASALKTKDFRFINIKKAGKKEVEEDEFSRRTMKDVRMCFTILENPITTPGERDVYLVYENPDGTVNTNFTAGFSGKFIHNDQEKVYTVMKSVNYDNDALEVCMDFSPAEENKYQKGTQYVSVYCDGRLIGQGTFEIK